MGTSQRHNPSVGGEPNWGKSSSSFSAAIKNLITLDNLDQILNDDSNEENAQDDDQQVHHSTSTQQQRNRERSRQRAEHNFRRNVHNSVSRLVRASGGKTRVSSGNLHTLGHAGVTVLGNFFNAYAQINQKGLASWLEKQGLNIEDCTWYDIQGILSDICEVDVIGLDETAANQAFSEMLEDLQKLIDLNGDDWESILQQHLNNERVHEIIDKYFGRYIFAHLEQNFREKLDKKYDSNKVKNYLCQIKDQIISDVSEGINGHDASHVDWSGEEGRQYIIDEFGRIISIFEEDED